jgi:transposase
MRMVDSGFGRDEIMAALDLGRSTYYKWLALYQRAGMVAMLESGVSTGAPTTLSEADERKLRSWIIGRDPRQFQFDFALWTRKIVRDLIRQKFDADMTLQGVGKLLRRLNLSPQRPLYRAWQRNEDAVRRWKAEEFPALRDKARHVGADLYFCDEASVRTDHHSGTTWGPVGATPVVVSTGKRESVTMISAITPRGEISFDVFNGTFNSTRFIAFLDKLASGTSNPIYLVVDGHPVHRSIAVKNHIASLNGKITLVFLPGYSPDPNPDEWVWKNVKHDQIGKRSVLGKGQITEFARAALQHLHAIPELVRGFSRDPALSYING